MLTFTGTNGSDEYNTNTLAKSYGLNEGFQIKTLGGNDNVQSYFMGRYGYSFDSIELGAGDDTVAVGVLDSVDVQALYSGGEGTDWLYIVDGNTIPTVFSRASSDTVFTDFQVQGPDGSRLTVNVGDDIEYITINVSEEESLYFLTEDLAAGRTRAVSWDEVYFRTFNENKDWYLNGINTYQRLYGDFLAKENTYQLWEMKTWSQSVFVNRCLVGDSYQNVLQAKQVTTDEFRSLGPAGSAINGTETDDIIRGLGGWDALSGNGGDDLIHGGNGREIISGGKGADELHGDFGWNTYLDERDGYGDLIVVKSDEYLTNLRIGSAGNNKNGEKTDFIEGLDTFDQVIIAGIGNNELRFIENVSHRGQVGVGIYAGSSLEALYTGGDLSATQLQQMTFADRSAQPAWSYWGENTVPGLVA